MMTLSITRGILGPMLDSVQGLKCNYPTSGLSYAGLVARCFTHLETEATTFHRESSRKLKLAKAEPSKLTTSSGKVGRFASLELDRDIQLARAELFYWE